MKIKTINIFDDHCWDEFVLAHPLGSLYHTSAWRKVIMETYKYIPKYYIIEDEEGNIKSGVPFFLIRSGLTGNRLVSLPFSDVSFPLVEDKEDIKAIMEAAIEEYQRTGSSYIEIRGAVVDNRFEKFDYYKTFILELSQDIKSIWNNFQKSTIQRSIKKAQRGNYKIYFGTGVSCISDFYSLNLLTRKKHGVIPQPLEFFENLWKTMRPQELIEVILARYQKKTIAGIIIFKFKDTVYYKYGASDSRYLWLRPNHLLMWEAIRFAKREGYRIFDFGRASPDNKGLMEFKRRWGTQELSLPYFYYPGVKGFTTTKEGNLKYKVMANVIRKIPIPISKMIGSRGYRHLG